MSYYDSGNRLQKITPMVKYIIIANVVVYALQILLKNYALSEWGSLYYFSSPAFYPHQIMTNFFMHDPTNPMHLVFNMFGLYFFGIILEKVWGSKRFLTFYLICGIGASIIVMLFMPFSASQFAKSIDGLKLGDTYIESVKNYLDGNSALGASGAIMGILGAFLYLFPNTELNLMLIPFPIKAKFVIPAFVLLDLFGGINYTSGDNVGHFAHIGGAIVGFLYVFIRNKTNKKTFY